MTMLAGMGAGILSAHVSWDGSRYSYCQCKLGGGKVFFLPMLVGIGSGGQCLAFDEDIAVTPPWKEEGKQP